MVIFCLLFYIIFFFKQKTAYEMRISDWSSDVCSSDLYGHDAQAMELAMTNILAGTLLVVSSFVTTNVWAADGGGDPSPEQPIEGWERRADISDRKSVV